MEKYQEDLINEHIKTANKIAYDVYKTASYALDLDEIKSIAYEGLVSAAVRWPKYCKETGRDVTATKFFYAYSRPRIHGAIYDWFRQIDWVPRSVRAKDRRLRDAGRDSGASVEEMAKISGLSEKEVSSTIRDMSKRPVSIEAEEIDYTSSASTEGSVLVDSMLEVLVDVIKEMDDIAKVILALHYFQTREVQGDKRTKGIELQQISKILGITEPRASKIHCDSVTRIRSALAATSAGKDWREEA